MKAVVTHQSSRLVGVAFASAATLACGNWSTLTDQEQPGIGSSFANPISFCESAASGHSRSDGCEEFNKLPSSPSWIRRNILASVGIPLPKPRLLTPKDPALKLPQKCIQRRQKDELRMRALLEKAPTLHGDPEKMKALGQELFEITYGKNITAQQREDFLIKYGCTGWNDAVIDRILQLCKSRGIVEMGAGHGQWARALTEAYQKSQQASATDLGEDMTQKRFDFVLAYDDYSNLPLNTHIYNAYTKPHHEFFGRVRKLETENDMGKVLRSWACRGRALLLVYPPPGPMALKVLKNYVESAPNDNDTLIFVGEGRGGANGDDAFFDYLEGGEWVLVEEMKVLHPPGDKGYERLFFLQRRPAFFS